MAAAGRVSGTAPLPVPLGEDVYWLTVNWAGRTSKLVLKRRAQNIMIFLAWRDIDVVRRLRLALQDQVECLRIMLRRTWRMRNVWLLGLKVTAVRNWGVELRLLRRRLQRLRNAIGPAVYLAGSPQHKRRVQSHNLPLGPFPTTLQHIFQDLLITGQISPGEGCDGFHLQAQGPPGT